MASQGYYDWIAAGKPLTPARPIREMVEAAKLEFPLAAGHNLFSWFADDAHYQADLPQDHTPFSATGWPLPSARWIVHATDFMHEPALGVDCHILFTYWIAEARAGRMPWLKYLIWEATVYSVRNNWEPKPSAGHYDHIHMSTRSDMDQASIGSWSPFPQEDQMTDEQAKWLKAIYEALPMLTELHAVLAGDGKRRKAANPSKPFVPDTAPAAETPWPVADGSVSIGPITGRLDMLKDLVKAIPSGGEGGFTEDQIRELVRKELDDTRLSKAS